MASRLATECGKITGRRDEDGGGHDIRGQHPRYLVLCRRQKPALCGSTTLAMVESTLNSSPSSASWCTAAATGASWHVIRVAVALMAVRLPSGTSADRPPPGRRCPACAAKTSGTRAQRRVVGTRLDGDARMRWCDLTQLPEAFCGGSTENSAPVAWLILCTTAPLASGVGIGLTVAGWPTHMGEVGLHVVRPIHTSSAPTTRYHGAAGSDEFALVASCWRCPRTARARLCSGPGRRHRGRALAAW
jgi:hypothetical protein